MKTITLHHHANGWMADFERDNEVRRLFGTTVLPTAFTARADAATVLHAVAKLNPDCHVQIGDPMPA